MPGVEPGCRGQLGLVILAVTSLGPGLQPPAGLQRQDEVSVEPVYLSLRGLAPPNTDPAHGPRQGSRGGDVLGPHCPRASGPRPPLPRDPLGLQQPRLAASPRPGQQLGEQRLQRQSLGCCAAAAGGGGGGTPGVASVLLVHPIQRVHHVELV